MNDSNMVVSFHSSFILTIRWIASVSLALGMCVILGWMIYYWLSPEWRTYLNTIKPNTALCFILSGIALWLYSQYPPHSRMNILSQLCGGMIFVIAMLTLFQYFFEINLGIDGALISIQSIESTKIFHPSRMSPFIATSLALIGFSLLFLDSRFLLHSTHQLLMSIVVVLSFATL